MAERRQNPVLAFLTGRGALIIITILIAAAVVYTVATGSTEPEDAPAPAPSAAPTAVLEGGADDSVAPSAGSGSPSPSATAQEGTEAPSGSGATPSPEPTLEIHIGNNQQAVEAADWKETADAFSAAWANPEGGKDAWLKRLRPYVTDSLYKSFGYTDISRVPSDTFRSTSPLEEGGGNMSFQAYFEEGGNRFNGLLQIQHDGTWLVKTIGSGGA
ncbi:hypothetical protein [Arthrobacter sp. IK3]|uniref:hypothetical protein n=1 Tax=Arthrobacter sp. IK3 TaxID=3448169 RepID=UPI003EE3666D